MRGLEGVAISRFAKRALKEPLLLEAAPPRRELGKITQWIHLADDAEHKLALLLHLLKQPEMTKVIVLDGVSTSLVCLFSPYGNS